MFVFYRLLHFAPGMSWSDDEVEVKDEAGDILSCSFCDSQFSHTETLKAHVLTEHRPRKKNNGKSETPCPDCGKIFCSRSDMRRHHRVVHMNIKFLCNTCGKELATKQQLERHILRYHTSPTESYNCKFCSDIFQTKYHLGAHMRKEHPGQGWKRNKTNEPEKDLIDPENPDFPAKCPFCEERFATAYLRGPHIRKMHPGQVKPKAGRKKRKIEAMSCSSWASTTAEFPKSNTSTDLNTEHAQNSCGPGNYTGGKMDSVDLKQAEGGSDEDKDDLKESFENDMGDNLFNDSSGDDDYEEEEEEEEFGEVKFETENEVGTDIKEEEAEFECTSCGISCYDYQELVRHVRKKHKRGMIELPCEQCDYKTFRRDDLTKHKRRMHEPPDPSNLTKNIICEECGFSTKRPSSMRDHMLMHSGMKHTCEHCGTTFTRERNLRSHIIQYHSGVELTCSHCDFTTNRKDSLDTHVSFKHMGVKFSCNLCTSSYVRERDLKRHVDNVHNNPKPDVPKHLKVKFPCSLCSKSFGRERDMRRHIREIHEQ